MEANVEICFTIFLEIKNCFKINLFYLSDVTIKIQSKYYENHDIVFTRG